MSIKDDMKKDLLKQVRPTLEPSTGLRPYSESNKVVVEDDLLEFAKKYKKTGGAQFEDKYRIGEGLTNLNPKVPFNKLPDGYVVPVFTGGQWIFANPTTRADGLVVPSGLNLSGGGAKKMSEKSKRILIHVLGMEVDENPIIVTKELVEKVSSRPQK